MNMFEYARASDLADAVRRIAAEPGAKFIAGGTNLVDLMKENVARPSRLIDITHLPLDKIEETKDGGLRIGALVANSDVAYHAQVAARYPLLASATHMSDGCVAMQRSLVPRIAWMRLRPPMAPQPEPGSRLLHGAATS